MPDHDQPQFKPGSVCFTTKCKVPSLDGDGSYELPNGENLNVNDLLLRAYLKSLEGIHYVPLHGGPVRVRAE